MKKNIALTFTSVLLLTLFFLLPKNRHWFTGEVITYWNDFNYQKNDLDTELRKIERWGNRYVISKQIAANFASKGLKNVLVLIPPSAYFKERGIGYPVPEPAVFYYYTGVKTIRINSKDAMQANWLVTADKGQVKLIPVTDKKILQDSINFFKKYSLD